jgi:hypothetical protein
MARSSLEDRLIRVLKDYRYAPRDVGTRADVVWASFDTGSRRVIVEASRGATHSDADLAANLIILAAAQGVRPDREGRVVTAHLSTRGRRAGRPWESLRAVLGALRR